jgi:hypothetical protein
VAKNFRRPMWLAMRPSGWGSFMQWRDDTTLPSRGLGPAPFEYDPDKDEGTGL